MKILIRVDSGSIIGTGHVMRCFNLINNLKILSNNIEAEFICRYHNNNIINLIKPYYNVHILPITNNVTLDNKTWLGSTLQSDIQYTQSILKQNTYDILLIDHYSIDYHWEYSMKFLVSKIIVIDDLFNRKHYCDILIDQNIYNHNPYVDLVPNHCKVLLGTDYLILNPIFLNYNNNNKSLSSNKIIIHISFGGSDIHNLTNKILNTVINNKDRIHRYSDIMFDVIIGKANCNYNDIKERYSNYNNIRIYYSVNNMVDLLYNSSFCIGSTGTSIYERIYMNKPSISITIADNQINIADTLHNKRLTNYIGHYDTFTDSMLIDYINIMINNYKDSYFNNIIDGKGCHRILDMLKS
jgi:UDP-2,4-diacetamido-2,4,6-trideoxy-beta-L-altropyranose hydrolase